MTLNFEIFQLYIRQKLTKALQKAVSKGDEELQSLMDLRVQVSNFPNLIRTYVYNAT